MRFAKLTLARRGQAAVDVSKPWVDRDSVQPNDADLGQPVEVLTFTITDVDDTVPITPENGLEVAAYDETNALLFGGFIRFTKRAPSSGVKRWICTCQSWGVRLFDAAVGSYNKNGVIDTDRNFIIGLVREALKNTYFGSASVAGNAGGPSSPAGGIDDPIITANEPNWLGIKGGAVMSGADWSYGQFSDRARDLINRAGIGASIRIRADKIVEYGVPFDRAPFILASAADKIAARGATGLAEFERIEDEEITDGHRNKLRLGGAAASEATAFDEVTYARLGRVIEEPYVNDTNIPAADVRRLAYARLSAKRIRRRARVSGITEAGLVPGQTVPIVARELGPLDPFGVYADVGAIAVPNPGGAPADNWAGELVVQKVKPRLIGDQMVFDVELGDNVREVTTSLAVKVV